MPGTSSRSKISLFSAPTPRPASPDPPSIREARLELEGQAERSLAAVEEAPADLGAEAAEGAAPADVVELGHLADAVAVAERRERHVEIVGDAEAELGLRAERPVGADALAGPRRRLGRHALAVGVARVGTGREAEDVLGRDGFVAIGTVSAGAGFVVVRESRRRQAGIARDRDRDRDKAPFPHRRPPPVLNPNVTMLHSLERRRLARECAKATLGLRARRRDRLRLEGHIAVGRPFQPVGEADLLLLAGRIIPAP